MLKEFTVKNFTSFNDEATFSMEADIERVSEHKEHIVPVNGNNLLKVVSMYGPNGGGKSNALLALRLAKMVQGSVGFSEYSEYVCIFSGSDVIEETIFFVDEKYEMGYRFGVTLDKEEDDDEFEENRVYRSRRFRRRFGIVCEEVSFRRAGSEDYILLFRRDRAGNVESGFFGEVKGGSELRLAKGKSVIRYLYDTFADNDGELSEGLDVIRRLAREINKITPLDNRTLFFYDDQSYMDLIKHGKELVGLLNDFDINIKGINFYAKKMNSPVYFVREIESDGKKVEKELSLNMESEGTRKIFWMLFGVLQNMKDGKIFYCNDMNAYLHPKMLRALIKLFQNNEYKSQLIFNSHDIINMDNELFRRDEIWFAYKDDNLSTNLVPLSNIVNYKGEQVRKDAKYYKQYLEGKYGADPFIGKGLNWNV